MSRIHEALQRAYLERGKASSSGDVELADPVEAFPSSAEVAQPAARFELPVDKIAQYAWSPSLPSLPTLSDRGATVEQFRGLRSHIYQARYETPLKTVLIASGMPAEGKSFVSANLAITLARNSAQNTLLIDGDLRRPTLHTLLGAPNDVGLSNYFEGKTGIAEIMQRDSSAGNSSALSNLTFISSGKTGASSSELVATHRMEELIQALAPHFDWIVIDAPPVLAVTDAVELSRAADAVLLVARAATTPYESAQRGKEAFSNSRVLGFVLNDVENAPAAGSYGYYYSHEPNDGAPQKKA